MQNVSLINIFKIFFKIGLILLGGGYVIVPIMQEELVNKKNWINSDDILDFYCISQSLPGIIAVNMAILVGCKLKKFAGALTALFAMCLSPFVIILVIANLLNKIMSIPFMESVFWGVNISIIILIYLTIKEIWQKSIVDKLTFLWFLIVLILSIIKINPIYLIFTSILFGIIYQFAKNERNNDE